MLDPDEKRIDGDEALAGGLCGAAVCVEGGAVPGVPETYMGERTKDDWWRDWTEALRTGASGGDTRTGDCWAYEPLELEPLVLLVAEGTVIAGAEVMAPLNPPAVDPEDQMEPALEPGDMVESNVKAPESPAPALRGGYWPSAKAEARRPAPNQFAAAGPDTAEAGAWGVMLEEEEEEVAFRFVVAKA